MNNVSEKLCRGVCSLLEFYVALSSLSVLEFSRDSSSLIELPGVKLSRQVSSLFSSFLPRNEELIEYVSLLHWVLRLGLVPGVCTMREHVNSEGTARCSPPLQSSWQQHCFPLLGATES